MGNQLYVGNLGCGVTNDTLTAMFEAYGVVVSVRVSTDRDTGRSKGFGFVEMGSDPEAQAAIKGINGREVEGSSLTVNKAMPEEGECRSAYNGGSDKGDIALAQPVVDRPSREADRVEPVVGEPHPVAHAVPQPGGADTGAGEGLLQDALPSICEAAGKVGGFKRLSEIAGQLGQYDEGE